MGMSWDRQLDARSQVPLADQAVLQPEIDGVCFQCNRSLVNQALQRKGRLKRPETPHGSCRYVGRGHCKGMNLSPWKVIRTPGIPCPNTLNGKAVIVLSATIQDDPGVERLKLALLIDGELDLALRGMPFESCLKLLRPGINDPMAHIRFGYGSNSQVERELRAVFAAKSTAQKTTMDDDVFNFGGAGIRKESQDGLGIFMRGLRADCQGQCVGFAVIPRQAVFWLHEHRVHALRVKGLPQPQPVCSHDLLLNSLGVSVFEFVVGSV